MASIKLAKTAVRKQMKNILNSLSTQEKMQQSKIVLEKLIKHEVYINSKRISIFLSMNDEIQTNDILQHALANQKHCFIPRYDSNSHYMDMVRIHSWDDYLSLPETKWKIKQPPLDEEREDALATGGLDLILIPGMAFTLDGKRMGRGKGYYDTFLSKCRGTQQQSLHTIALAFKEQILSDLPTEETDVPIGHIICAD